MQVPLTAEAGWRYVSDKVMGGVSEGQAQYEVENDAPVLRLSGAVSTANRGGFIQARMDLGTALPAETTGVVLSVKGNGQPYFIHLRTRGTALPWQYYQAKFMAEETWQEVRLPFTAFKPSGGLLRQTPRAAAIKSIGVVAYGRDHQADLSVRTIGFY